MSQVEVPLRNPPSARLVAATVSVLVLSLTLPCATLRLLLIDTVESLTAAGANSSTSELAATAAVPTWLAFTAALSSAVALAALRLRLLVAVLPWASACWRLPSTIRSDPLIAGSASVAAASMP